MKLKIGSSLICGAPFSPLKVARSLESIGFDCCQAAILKGWGKNYRNNISVVDQLLPIISWELPWKEDCRLRSVLKGKRQHNPLAATFFDWFLFPRPEVVDAQSQVFRQLPDCREVVHDLSHNHEGRVLEVSHKMNCSLESAIEQWSGTFCVDLYHSRRELWEEERILRRQFGIPEDNFLGHWKQQFALLFSTEQVKFVHISPFRMNDWAGSEGDRFCRYEKTDLAEMIRLALELGGDQIAALIVELNIRSIRFSKIITVMEQMHDRLREFTN